MTLSLDILAARMRQGEDIPLSDTARIALALSQSILEAGGGAWRMQGGGFAGTIPAFVPAPLLEAYCAAIESVFGPGSCYRLKLREQGAIQIGSEM